MNLWDDSSKSFAPDAWSSAWKPVLAGPASQPTGVDWFAMVLGLGFVLSLVTGVPISWSSSAMAAKNMSAARRTPLIAAVPKMLFPVLVILPGILAVVLTALPEKNYRIPQAQIETANYPAAIAALNQAVAQKSTRSWLRGHERALKKAGNKSVSTGPR